MQASLGLMVGREATKEILQRGFVLAGLAGWLTDRLYEADVGGADGSLVLGGVPVTLHEVGLLAASVLTTTLFAPAAYIAAEEAAAGVSGVSLCVLVALCGEGREPACVRDPPPRAQH
jgi:hypothetical protein